MLSHQLGWRQITLSFVREKLGQDILGWPGDRGIHGARPVKAGLVEQLMEQRKGSSEKPVLRVLVIDDNKAHAEGLAELLGLAGFEAWHVLTGGEGIEAARTLHVDAVLLDMNLPDMNGFEVCRKLRRDLRTAHIAVVFHTAQGSVPGARHEGDAFLTYPVAMQEVYATIRNSVARRKNRMGRVIE